MRSNAERTDLGVAAGSPLPGLPSQFGRVIYEIDHFREIARFKEPDRLRLLPLSQPDELANSQAVHADCAGKARMSGWAKTDLRLEPIGLDQGTRKNRYALQASNYWVS